MSKDSQDQLESIESSLRILSVQQAEICARIAGLERAVRAESVTATPREKLLDFLDQFRAGEALGEASLGAWIEVCTTDCLKGGLRTIQMREGSHAKLLADRMKELGGSPKVEIPDSVYESAMSESSSREKSDAEKVKRFIARFPDCDAALKPILDMADTLDHDQETQSLLRTIASDERATLEFLQKACAQLNP